MSITYNYEVISVDQQARCMEVVYSSEGRQTLHISARLPFVNETLESIISMYAPIAYWSERDASVQAVQPGVSGTGKQADPYAPTPKEMALSRRQIELSASDWTQLPDVPLTEHMRSQWVAYRQALRDVTSQAGFPDNITWPTPPSMLQAIPVATL